MGQKGSLFAALCVLEGLRSSLSGSIMLLFNMFSASEPGSRLSIIIIIIIIIIRR
jgi:hypothetical protein